ncbi:hypothetical protein L1887_55263 [Cichorium endivia]|nr:hypothetical protein L1887_55263 [Cichorium endivia]
MWKPAKGRVRGLMWLFGRFGMDCQKWLAMRCRMTHFCCAAPVTRACASQPGLALRNENGNARPRPSGKVEEAMASPAKRGCWCGPVWGLDSARGRETASTLRASQAKAAFLRLDKERAESAGAGCVARDCAARLYL